MAVPQSLIQQFKATEGKPITCKAAVAWEAKKPLDVTDVQVCISTRGISDATSVSNYSLSLIT